MTSKNTYLAVAKGRLQSQKCSLASESDADARDLERTFTSFPGKGQTRSDSVRQGLGGQ